MDPSFIPLTLIAAAIGLTIQYWIIRGAVRSAIRDRLPEIYEALVEHKRPEG